MPERRRFNGAVAALCACSLTLALVSVVQNLPMNSPDTAATDGWAPMSAVNVGLQNGPTQGPAEHFRTVPVRQPDGTLIYVNPANGQVVAPDFFRAVSDDASLNF
jgi:hypothetical protein